jgi:flagellar biosynthesis/type III secretory pathway protein FliH
VTIKIIKQGSLEPSRIMPFSFADDRPLSRHQPPSLQEDGEGWPAGLEPNTPKDIAQTSVPTLPSIDVDQLEKKAFENGYRQGEKAGLETADKQVSTLMASYADAVLQLGKYRRSLYAQVERDVVKLALEVAKKIVHREIQADREIIQTLVRVALGHVAEKSAVTVHLHPTDYNYILEHRAELSKDGEGGQEVVLLSDKAIQRGGCLVETECGTIDARIEEEFREVERCFFEGVK